MADSPARSSNYEDALRVRHERLALIQAVLQIQREHYMVYGEFPSATQVAEHMGLGRAGSTEPS